MHVCVSHVFLVSSELEEAIGSLGAEVKNSCGPPCGVRMLLTSRLFPQSQSCPKKQFFSLKALTG